MFIAKLLLT